MIDVGVIGTGAIGSKVAHHVSQGDVPKMRLSSVYNRTPEKAADVVASLDSDHPVAVASEPIDVANQSDVVVEAASQQVIEESAVEFLASETDLVVMSVGAFRDPELLREVQTTAEANNSSVYVPSGAIGGLDGVGAIGNGSIEELSLTCYRPPEYLVPYVAEGVDVTELPDGEAIFDGNAAEAAAAYPAHMNVALALTLTARVDPSDVEVRIFVQRSAPRSRYVVRARGDAGSVTAEIENFKTTSGAETSKLTVASVVEKLRRITDSVVIGT